MGLTVLGVTRASEPRDKTEDFIKQTGAKYPYAYAKDNALYEAAGVSGIPHAVLIDPQGNIVWSGHPSTLSKSTLEENLKGASKFISYGWSEDFKDVAKAVGSAEFAKAIAAVDSLLEKGVEGAADVRAGVLGLLEARLAPMRKAMEAGDYYAAFVVADELDGKLKGLEQEQAVDTVLETIKKDSGAKEIFDGQKKLQKIVQGELRKKKQFEQAIDGATRLADKYAGTIVEKQARECIEGWKKRLSEK